jgi:DNA-binding NarL/FixJ family response regulator
VIRVLVVDDNDVIRSGLRALLTTVAGVEVVGEAATGREAIARTEELTPDVVLLDVRMPVMDGVSAAAVISQHAQVVMLTYTDEPEAVAGALRNGASGYLVHGRFGTDELARAIRDVAAERPAVSPAVVPALLEALRNDATAPPALGLRAGEHPLTAREAEVMDAIAAGRSNAEIAGALHLAEKTVKNTINRIYAKLGATARSEAIARWVGTDGR